MKPLDFKEHFTFLQIKTSLSPCCQKEIPGQCFRGAEKHDLLWHGRKIAGAAQRRSKTALLIQGSVQPPPIPVAKIDWQKAMCDVAHRNWNVHWQEFELNTSLRALTEKLAREKYSQESFNRKR